MAFKLKRKNKNEKKEKIILEKDIMDIVDPMEIDSVESTRVKMNKMNSESALLTQPSDMAKLITDIQPEIINKEVIL